MTKEAILGAIRRGLFGTVVLRCPFGEDHLRGHYNALCVIQRGRGVR